MIQQPSPDSQKEGPHTGMWGKEGLHRCRRKKEEIGEGKTFGTVDPLGEKSVKQSNGRQQQASVRAMAAQVIEGCCSCLEQRAERFIKKPVAPLASWDTVGLVENPGYPAAFSKERI